MITKKKFCLSKILKGGLPCPNPKIQWVVPHSDCLTSPCDSCTDECIELTMLEGCDANCVHVIIECPDCDSCAPQTHKVCFCNDNEDCGICETCSSAGVCVEKCEHCDETTGECGECSGGDCPGDLECIQGKCQCPPGSVKDGEICRYCTEDSECGPCRICTEDGKCVPKDCGSGVCDPLTGDCIGCTNSGHCGPNEICDDGDCVCAPGYVYDPVQGCIPQPPCESDSECGPCMKCTSEGCVPITCPDGKICVDGECVDLCNCDEPSCSKAGYGCQRISSDLCACLPCEDDKPCTEIPCNNGLDCPDGWGCKDGICVPCSTLNCGTGECDEVLGCECVGSRCMDSDNKCSGSCYGAEDCGPGCTCYRGRCVSCDNFACPDECGNIEGCGCQGDGTCGDDGKDCSDTFEINKRDDNCQIEGVLVSEKSCQCPRVSMNAKVHSVSSPTQFIRGINFLIELRKGDADEEGILNLPLLRDTGIANEFPLSGSLRVRVIEKIKSSNYATPVSEDVVYSQVLSLTAVDTVETGMLNFNPPGSTKINPNTGSTEQVGEVEIQFVLDSKSLNFWNSCSYSEEDVVLSYRITANGGNGFIKYSDITSGTSPFIKYEVLQSASDRNPVFFWYKSGDNGVETMFRSSYPEETSPGVFKDGWLGVDEGVEIGKFYRLEADCSCDGTVFYTCPESGAISKLRYCNPKNLAHKLVFDLKDCNKTISFNPASNTFPVCEANSRGGQVYELYLNGRKVAEFTASNGQVVFSGSHTATTSITEIEVRLKGHNCDRCYETKELIPAELEVSDLSYDCDTETLGFSIVGGSGSYNLAIDDIPYPLSGAITLSKGEHKVVFTDANTGCTSEGVIQVDCCANFEISAENSSICIGATDLVVEFEVTGGKAPYTYSISDGTTATTPESTNLDSNSKTVPYSGVSGTYTLSVWDSRGCEKEVNFQVVQSQTPEVTLGDLNYCDGDTTKEVSVTVTGAGSSYDYALRKYGESSPIESGTVNGAFSVNVPIAAASPNKYEIEIIGESECSAVATFDLVYNECPTPIVEVHSGEVCQNKDLIVTAVITQGSGEYTWTIEHNGQLIDSCNTGCGSVISYNTGTTLSKNQGAYSFKVTVTDGKGKIGTDTGTIVVTPTGGANCCDEESAPTVTIGSFGGFNREIGETIILVPSNTSFGNDAYTWFEVNPATGEFYPDPVATTVNFNPGSSTAYSRTFAVRYNYEGECYAFSPNVTLNVVEEGCDCTMGIKVNSGIPELVGKPVVTTGNSSNLGKICHGDIISLSATSTSGCPNVNTPGNVSWVAYAYRGNDHGNRADFWTGTGDSFIIPTTAGSIENNTIVVSMSIQEGNCSATAVGFEVPIGPCQSADPFTLSFTQLKSSICESEESNLPVTFKVNAGAKPGGGYDTFNFNWRLDKKVGSSYTMLKNGLVSGSWSGNSKTVSETIDISNHISPTSGPMTLALRVKRTDGGGWTEITRNITSLGSFSTQCSQCTDKNLQVNVTQAPIGTITIDKGTSINLTAEGSVNSPFILNGPVYQWTWDGGSSLNKTISVTPQETTTYNVKVTDSAGCEASTSVTVYVQTPCQDVTFNTFEWDIDQACPGDNVTLTYNVGTNVGYKIWVNGNPITTTGNSGTYNTTMVTGEALVAKIEATYKEGCDPTIFTDTVQRSPSSTCCTLPNSLEVNIDTHVVNGNKVVCPGEDVTVTPVPNGDDDGYLYTWYDAATGGSSLGTSNPGESFVITQPTSLTSGTGAGFQKVEYAEFRVEATKSSCPTRTKVFRLYFNSFGAINGLSIPASGTDIVVPFCVVGLDTNCLIQGNVASVDSYVVEILTPNGTHTTPDLASSVTVNPSCLGNPCSSYGQCSSFRLIPPSFDITGYPGGYNWAKVIATVTFDSGYSQTWTYTQYPF